MLAFVMLKNAEDVAFLHDEKVFAVDLDFSAGPFAEENAVAFFHIESDELTLLIASAGTDCDNFALLRLLLGRVRYDDPALRALFLFETAHYHAVMQRPEFHGILLRR